MKYLGLLAWVLSFIFVVSSALASPPPTAYRYVFVDSAFSEGDVSAIRLAVRAWNRTLGGNVRLLVYPTTIGIPEMFAADRGEAILVLQVDSTCTFIPHTPYSDNAATLAWVNKLGGNKMWVVRDRLRPEDVAAIVLHELGHVFGAADRDGPGLMHKYYDPVQYMCVDEDTAKEVALFMGLPLGRMRYCETLPIK